MSDDFGGFPERVFWSSETTVQALIIFVVMTLFCIIIIFVQRSGFRKLTQWSILLITSVAIGIVAEFIGLDTGILFLDPTTMVYVVFPILIIASGFRVTWSIVQVYRGIVLYSLPMLIYSVFMTGVIINVASTIFPFNYSLGQSITVGAVLSTIDFSSMLSVISKDIDPREYLYLFSFAESAIAFSTQSYIANVFMRVDSTDITTKNMILTIVTLLVGFLLGAVIGILVALLVCTIIKISWSCEELQPFLLIGGCYISYLAAGIFGFSRGMTLTSCILVIRRFGFPALSSTSRRHTVALISGIANITNSFLLISIGLQTANLLIRSFPVTIYWSFVFFCFSITFIVRFHAVFLFGRQMRVKYALSELTMLSLGGLKGTTTFVLMNEIVGSNNEDIYQQTLVTVLILIIFSQIVIGNLFIPFVKARRLKTPMFHRKQQLPGVIISKVMTLTRDIMFKIAKKESTLYQRMKRADSTLQRVFLNVKLSDDERFWQTIREAQLSDIQSGYEVVDKLMTNAKPPTNEKIARDTFAEPGTFRPLPDITQNSLILGDIANFASELFREEGEEEDERTHAVPPDTMVTSQMWSLTVNKALDWERPN